ncbi:MAG: hypothetical protein H0T73_10850, partial [Ardenticatenales bacterium]|nr:hypothetical protein [Ardenticatenales bacterium]
MGRRLQSRHLPITGGQSYDLYAHLRGQGDPDTGAYATWAVRATFYNSAGASVGTLDAATGTLASLTTTWSRKGSALIAPATATEVMVELIGGTGSGWLAFDDVSLIATGSGGGSTMSAPSTMNLTTSDAPTPSNLEPAGELLTDPGFEGGAGWSAVADLPDESFEGGTGWSTTEGQASTTAIYRTTCCTALPHTGSYA